MSSTSTSSMTAERRLRARLIEAYLAFSAMPGLIHRTRRLACNAEVACARAGTEAAGLEAVTRELGTMSHELDHVLGDLAGLFHGAAVDAARWVQAEARVRAYQRVLDALSARPRRWEPDLSRETGVAWAEEREAAQGDAAHIWERLEAARREALARLRSLTVFASHLRRTLDQIDLVAVRKSRFVGVLAEIEAARSYSTDVDFTNVSSSIRSLGDEVASTAGSARDEVSDLGYLLDTVLAPLGEAISETCT